MKELSSKRVRFIIYAVATALVIALMIIGLAAWRSASTGQEAEAKADQLIAAISTLGVRTPARDQVVNLLGTDGGPICVNPNEALARAGAMAGMANGAGGPGTRPVIATARIVRGEALVLSIYCPDKLPAFQQFVDTLRTGG